MRSLINNAARDTLGLFVAVIKEIVKNRALFNLVMMWDSYLEKTQMLLFTYPDVNVYSSQKLENKFVSVKKMASRISSREGSVIHEFHITHV